MIARLKNFVLRKISYFVLYPIINKKYRGSDFFENHYSSRESVTRKYLFFNKTDANIFANFVSWKDIQIVDFPIKIPTQINREKKNFLLMILTDHFQANVILIEELVKLNLGVERILIKPHPRESEKNKKSLISIFRKKWEGEFEFLEKNLSLNELPKCNYLLMALGSSINYFLLEEMNIYISKKASSIDYNMDQFECFINSIESEEFILI